MFACSARGRATQPSGFGGTETEVTLYRDHAAIAQRFTLDIPAGAPATVRIRVAAGIEPDAIYLAEKSELILRDARIVGGPRVATPAPPIASGAGTAIDAPPPIDAPDPGTWGDVDEPDESGPADEAEPVVEPPAILTPTELELVIAAPRAGRYTVVVGYDTERITWDAAYTLTTTPARDRATPRGALAIRNATGLSLPHASLWIVDAEHGPPAFRIADRIGARLVDHEGGTSPLAVPRHLGMVDLVEGDTRVELLAGVPPAAMHPVLVYDPVGTALDHPGFTPLRDSSFGLAQSMSNKVTEGYEIERDAGRTDGMPAGPVRLLERRADGSLGVLGEARMFEASARIAHVDRIAIATADGVTGRRERRELSLDEDRKRLTEEFTLAIENKRDRPVEIVLREHLYRGRNWALAYQSVPLQQVAKEGAQQVVMRIVVPARTAKQPGKLTVMYVAVYTW